MGQEEPNNMQDIIRGLQKSGDQLNPEKLGIPITKREARNLIFFGLNLLTFLFVIGLWQVGKP
ncbi:hypothetical protein [Prochlorococcus sp. MIT 1307]|uniref:hypothetical protein n=1 Tax=Prochlorococcus sp. MIT 1307 TaxID=3096219 RepID=UPI002A7529C6|nr:hypothetical protein [Prochlorococcus sp. MIT 1307]